MIPFFSIVIPAYNCKNFIWQCVTSLTLEQSIQKNKVEILIINDASTDGSAKIIRSIGNLFLNVKILENKNNQGVSASRNKGIKNASGEYIIFLDSDDYLKKDCLKLIYNEILIKNKPDVIFGRFIKKTYPFNNDTLIKSYNYSTSDTQKFIKKIIYKKFPLDECWPYIVKKSFLLKNKINFLNVRVAEDQLYVVKILVKMQTFCVYKNTFYIHQNLAGSLSDFMDLKSAICCLKVLLEYVKLINSKVIKSNITLSRFVNIYIQGLFSMFTSLLIMRNKKEIFVLSKVISKYHYSYNYLNKYPEDINLGLMIKAYGSFNGLLFYKKKITNIKYNIISNFIKNKSNIYFYCYSKFLGASRIIMGKSWFIIKSILDQNINLKNKIFNKKKIVDPDSLVFSNNDSIIINNHREITIKKIFNSLVAKGINKKNILILRY
jgi:glycosyltransferase involved in cell wall biosynthesis